MQIRNDKFVAENESVETFLKQSTVGLVQLEEFQKIREGLGVPKERDSTKSNDK